MNGKKIGGNDLIGGLAVVCSAFRLFHNFATNFNIKKKVYFFLVQSEVKEGDVPTSDPSPPLGAGAYRGTRSASYLSVIQTSIKATSAVRTPIHPAAW